MRVPSGDELVYLTYRLALCDDSEEADGDRILNWSQAKQKAEHWFASQLRAGSKTRIGPQTIKLEEAATALNELTVKEAVDAYVTMRDARDKARIGRAVKSDAHRLKLHVLEGSELGHLPLDSLSEDNLRAWTDGLADMKASTRKRLVNDFKAALNDTYRRHRKVLPPDFAIIIRHGLVAQSVPEGEADSGVRENQILTDQQVARLIATSMSLDPDGDAARVIILLAATGARFSQLRRMQVRDVQCDQSRLMVPPSRKGKGKTVSRIRVQVGADVLAALEPILVSRPASATLLERWRHKQTAPATWVRADRGAWQTASELTRFWKKVADQENLPNLVPYALRHSSIVRGIRVGLPIRLVAALHDTSVAMIERHYSRWITEGLDDLAAKAVVPLITMTDAAVSDSEADSGPDQWSQRSCLSHTLLCWISSNRLAPPQADNLKSLTGRGVSAVVVEDEVLIGKAEMFGTAGIAPLSAEMTAAIEKLRASGQTSIIARRYDKDLGAIGLLDTPREAAKATLRNLRAIGIKRMVMISGDHQRAADAIAMEVGIDEAWGDLMPEDKVEAVKKLRAETKVAMVGDGVNDAPAMATATVGIAMGAAGSDVALETADVALMADDLAHLPFAVGLSRSTRWVIRQNVFVSLGVVAFLVPATILGLGIGPAVMMHEGLTLLVVCNALRLLAYRNKGNT